MEKIELLTVFPFLTEYKSACGDLSGCRLIKGKVDTAKKEMLLDVWFDREVSPADAQMLSDIIKKEYNLNSVAVRADFPRPKVEAAEKAKAEADAVLMGKVIKGDVVPMNTVGVDSGTFIVEGDVISVTSRRLNKRGGAVLGFELADKTGAYKVNKYLSGDDNIEIIDNIDVGQYLRVRGKCTYNRFEDDIIIDPTDIMKSKKEIRKDNAPVKRVELHAHTRFSALDALTSPADYVKRAAYWGMPACAITDHGVVQAFPEACNAAAKSGIKLIYGCEIYFRPTMEQTKTYHMVVLVKNKVGLKNLYKIVSEAHLNYFHRSPTVPKHILDKYREGLIIGTACGMGELYGAVMYGEPDEKLEEIASYYDYLEIQPIPNNGFLIADGRVSGEVVLQEYNRRILNLGKKLGKPVIAASDVHFLDAEDEQYRKILQAAKQFKDADRDCPIYFRTTEEMLAEFTYLGKEDAEAVVITNTNIIADMVETFDLFPKGLFPPRIENSQAELKRLVYEKMHRIYGENPPQIVQERVDVELNTILDHDYDVIYMSAQKLVQNSLEHGYMVGSRGSVGSSIVAFMSGITEVNSLPAHYVCPNCKYSDFESGKGYGCGADMPEKKCPVCGADLNRDGFDIPFETFLGFPGNEKTPDIDLNFSGEYQAQAHKYTETLFGSDHVFKAGTVGTIADNTAYGYVKNYLNERGIKTTKADENRLAKGLVGIKRTTSQHPGGLVVVPQDMDVTDFCPVQHPADDANSGIITTHFEYHSMESNLLKLDELGHDDPTMIRMMEDMTHVDAKKISLSDPDTMKIFVSPAVLGLPEDDEIIGKTGSIGIPEFGTGFTRQMLVDTKPKDFDTLIRLSGFSHGTDVWAGNIRDLIVNGVATVSETVGCRDDIMIFLISKGMDSSLSFKIMEHVRKGKAHKTGGFPGDSEAKMRELGVPDWYIESCRKIQYLFPKAHAVAYVMMAFRIAWFKVHYPLAFYSAYFYRRSQKGSFDAEIMSLGADGVRMKINNMKKEQNLTAKDQDILVTLEAVYEFNMRGFSFAPISIFESDSVKFKPVGETQLRLPFIAVSGLGLTAAQDLENAGKLGEGAFMSVEEIGHICPKVSTTCLDQLKNMGVFGDMPDSSQISLFGF